MFRIYEKHHLASWGSSAQRSEYVVCDQQPVHSTTHILSCSCKCSCAQCSTVQYIAVQCSTVQCSVAVQCSSAVQWQWQWQCSAVQCSAVQYSAVQCRTVQYSAVQCSSAKLHLQRRHTSAPAVAKHHPQRHPAASTANHQNPTLGAAELPNDVTSQLSIDGQTHCTPFGSNGSGCLHPAALPYCSQRHAAFCALIFICSQCAACLHMLGHQLG